MEIFSNHDYYSKYLEYNSLAYGCSDSDPNYCESNYILGAGNIWAGRPLYTMSTDSIKLESSFVDPNYDLQFLPKFTDIRFNTVLKWNYIKGSNLYIVYSFNKAVNGQNFSSYNQITNFLNFNKYEPWVEVLRDQTLMIKIDYWFEK